MKASELGILEPKLDSLARCLERIESKKPFTQEDLEKNPDLQDIISVNLERAVQQAVDIAALVLADQNQPAPLTMAEGFDQLKNLGILSESTATRMKKAVGFRNLLVHEYEKVDWSIAHKIAYSHLGDFKAYAQEIVNA